MQYIISFFFDGILRQKIKDEKRSQTSIKTSQYPLFIDITRLANIFAEDEKEPPPQFSFIIKDKPALI